MKKEEKKIVVYLRNLERGDIPKVSSWLSSKEYLTKKLSSYPTAIGAIKNQLLKELAVSKLIFSRTMLLVAEVNSEILVGFICLRNIDWRNRHLELHIYIPPEFTNSDLPKIITKQVYDYIFLELGMHKIYHLLTPREPERIEAYKKEGKEPEAILYDFIPAGDSKEDLYIFATYRREVIARA